MKPIARTVLLCSLLALTGCSPLYVLRAGIEEAKILSRRRPIVRVMQDSASTAETRRKLGLVLQARDYAARVLALNAGESYTTYSWVESDTLLLVVSGSRRDRFQAYTWWFPVIGHVPYKGFFDFASAHREAERLERAGYDAYVRPAGAFSTLGWFNDPLLNTMLRYDDVSLVSTVIHELLHNTVYIPSRINFNESFANFVGDRGTIEFFCTRDGETSDRCRAARDGWSDNLQYGAFLTALVAELDSLYQRTDLPLVSKLRLREEVFERAKQHFTTVVEPALRTRAFRGFARRPLNNATLIGTRLYYDRLHLFEAVYERYGRDFNRAVQAILAAAEARPDDPYGATSQLLAAPSPAAGAAQSPELH